MKTTVISLFAATAIAAGYATHAAADVQTSPDTQARKVGYSDLNLSTAQGAGALLHRIRRAAALVCSAGDPSPMQQWTSRGYRKCVRQASDRAVADVHSPMVTAIYSAGREIKIAGK